ncbi:MAG TPA: Gfo/Idh/MocA family oxidoreductase [Opitutaceae bacterium]|nr:Gfo/Idh/MocA family oxidoreductase [Opitutaceae bacterium]
MSSPAFRPAVAAPASLDRRSFLKTSSLAGLGLAAGSPVFSAEPGDRRHRYAIVGTGSRSRLFQEAIEKEFRDHVRLAALCDLNPGRLQLAAERSRAWGGTVPALYASENFEKMLSEQAIQTVLVTTMDGNHHEFIVRAMEAGCDVISEKPMTTTPEKCRQILEAQARTGRTCRVTFNLRYSPPCTQVKDVLMSGEIGDVQSVDLHWMLDTRHGADYMRRWHSRKENSGGLMIHKASHHFDLVNWWLGAVPVSVFATGKRDFYQPKTLRRMGLSGAHERCLTCPESDRCAFYVDIRKDADLKSLYLDQEKYDGYVRDRCPFRGDINIEDTMNVLVRYNTGATLTYSLNAFCAWEGYTVAFNGTRGRLEHSAGGLTPDGRVERYAMRTTLFPLRGAPKPLEVWTGVGSHQGGDKVMLEDLFLPHPKPDKYLRAADHRAGAVSTLIGMAANECFLTERPVQIAHLAPGLAGPDYAPMPTADSPLTMPPRG